MRTLCLVVMLHALPVLAVEPGSSNYRLIGATAASVAATPASPQYRVQLAGGSGGAIGIAASANSSVVAGPTSTQLPTDRIFRAGLED